jgi:ABC-type multidrug transport system ATPase subunit
MSLLALERIYKRRQDGRSERVLLDDVSMSLNAGELVAILGMRDSGRSTLLQIAAGIQPPDSGLVRFEGRELGGRKGSALGEGIGYCSHVSADREAGAVLEELMVAPRARGVGKSDAQARARAALERVGAAACAGQPFGEALLVIDEPLTGIDLLEQSDVFTLVRSLADDGIAVLTSASESTGFPNADRTLLIRSGVLAGDVDPVGPSVHQLLSEAGA